MTEPTQDRRRFPRLEFQAPLHYRPTTLREGTARELSFAGITFVTNEELTPGTELDLYLINRNIHLRGVVTHQEAHAAGQFRTGLHFEREEPELVQVLASAWRAKRG